MKSETGLGAAALILATAMGIGSHSAKAPVASSGAATNPTHVTGQQAATADAESEFDRGPCGDLESTLRTFLMVPGDEIAAPSSCYGSNPKSSEYLKNQSISLTFQQKASSLQFVIAILPDPLHTHFSLSFDRMTEAIQQAAQAEGYFYDFSWLPWETEEKPLVLLADQDKAEKQKRAREEQPGVLLFRGKPENCDESAVKAKWQPGEQPYCSGLAVFIVGEEPTGGIHKTQFENAVSWITALRPHPDKQVKILGPTFSGSLPSLAQLLAEARSNQTISTLYAGSVDGKLSIYSGGVTSNELVDWFVSQPGADIIRFRSFEQDGNSLFRAYRAYLKSLGFEASHLAILSEDETAYGGYRSVAYGDYPSVKNDLLCKLDPALDKGKVGPTCLYYPRDLSALRAAYQKEGIFSAGSKAESSDATQRQLASDLADPEGSQHDSIRAYSGDQLALAQEAILAQIVSLLRSHESQYIVLRSSNPLDQLFLSHYLRKAYPAGRIVVEGSDLLLRRETGSAALSGIMTLTSYPLLPWGYHWTALKGGDPYLHVHPVFAQEGSESTYIALRFLLNAQRPGMETANLPDGYRDVGHQACLREADCEFLMPNRFAKSDDSKLVLPDYRAPFWNLSSKKPKGVKNLKYPEDFVDDRPSVWLSVLGRDGFWPVAALTIPADNDSQDSSKFHQLVQFTTGTAQSWWHLVTAIVWPVTVTSEANYQGWPEWPPMPLSMKICLLVLMLLAAFHLHCCTQPSVTVKPVHRAHFVWISDSHSALIVFGSSIVAFIPILLAWGYGAMSAKGEPVPFAWWYRVTLPLSWLLAGSAVWFNVRDRLIHAPKKRVPNRWILRSARVLRHLRACFRNPRLFFSKNLRTQWVSPAIYLAITILTFLVVDFFLEQSLNDANRIPTYWRSIHLTTGVSPLVPLLALTAGLYLWFWYSLQGLALFGPDRPMLPDQEILSIDVPTQRQPASPESTGISRWLAGMFSWQAPGAQHVEDPSNRLQILGMFSHEGVAEPLEKLCDPFAKGTLVVAVIVFSVLGFGACAIAGWSAPIRNLGSVSSSIFVCLYIDLCISLMLANAWQFIEVWLRLRNLLLFLDRIPLRRTTKMLKDISWGSVWKMSGSILDVRYKLLSRQLESLTHLENSLARAQADPSGAWKAQIDQSRQAMSEFAKWYAKNWDNWRERNLTALANFQNRIAETAGYTFAKHLLPEWRKEEQSLILDFSEKKTDESQESDESDKEGEDPGFTHRQRSLHILNAEELVCLVYLGFVQNILGRLRTLAMQMLWLFIALSAAVATYPFDPRPALSGTMLVLFVIVGTVVVIVYAQMHRDGTLSLVTKTTPGKLGLEFWIKLVSFAAGPILGLLAANFPGLIGSLFSWLQPGLESIK